MSQRLDHRIASINHSTTTLVGGNPARHTEVFLAIQLCLTDSVEGLGHDALHLIWNEVCEIIKKK